MGNVRSLTMQETVKLITEECCTCGVLFAMAARFQRQCRDHPMGTPQEKGFYCPAGHIQYYTGPTEAQRQRQRAERAEQQLASRDEDLRVERASHAATKGQLTRTRRRALNGVCPCCHRTFQQLARHMRVKHPDFQAEAAP
jgi:hypothetical protein